MKLFFCFKIIVCSLSVNMLKLVNLYRKYYDLEALKPIPKLQMASDLQANTMCKTKRLTHDGIKGRETVRKRAEAFNFIGLNVGENIAKQENDDYKEVFKMWLKSKGHRKNILGNYDYTAVTTCRARDGNRYWVQVFGKGKKNGNDQGDKSRNDQGEGTKGDGNKDDIDQGEETKNNETPSVINQLQENDQPDGEGSGTPNPLTSFMPLKSPNNQTEIQERFSEEEKPPISYETTISISRKYDKPSMVNTSTVGPMNPPLVNQDEESENMEFLFKEGEDTQKVLKKIPPNYHLSFKGNFRKYVAMKNKMKDKQSERGPGKQPEEKPNLKDESSKLPSMEPRFDQHKPQDKPKSGQRPSFKPQQPIFKPQQPKESSPKQQSPIKEKLDKLLKPEHPATPKPQQPKDKPKEAKLPDGNQVNGMFKTILDKIKKLEDKKNSGKLPSLTIDLPQIAQPTSAALSSSSTSVIKSTTTQPPSTSTEVIYKTVYKYKDAPESSVKPSESTEKPKESTEKPKESTEKQKESTEKPKESTEKPKESTEKQKESTEKPKESTEKPKESTEKPKESTEKPIESTEKPKESTEKPKESTEKSKEPSSIAYKTTKIGSYSILDSESKIKTITVTVLKDSISPSSTTQSVSPSVSSVLDFIDKPGTTPDHDEENLGEFDSKVKKLFKDLIDTKKKRRLFRLAPNLEKDTESRLKDYVKKLIDSEDPIEKDGVLDCSVIDIGEPAVD